MIRRPPRSTPSNSSAASDVYKRQFQDHEAEQAPLFVHIKQCNGATTLREGDEVTFDKKWNDVKGKYDIDNCTIIRASTTSESARSTSKFENDRSEWRKGKDTREGKWTHDKHLAMYREQDPADSARSSSSQQPNKRQRILQRYTAPHITIHIDCGYQRRLSMTCQESTPVAAVRRFVAAELGTSEANVRLTICEGAHAYTQSEDELPVRNFGVGNGSTLRCTVVNPLKKLLALLNVDAFPP